MANNMSDSMSDNMSEYVSDFMSNRMTDRISDLVPDNTQDKMADRMSENMPDKVSARIRSKISICAKSMYMPDKMSIQRKQILLDPRKYQQRKEHICSLENMSGQYQKHVADWNKTLDKS